ncbi:MAG TPA: hypothetical protein EYQ80_08150 [Candidatus Poseidoniales archaeon]|nr:hypothetical protein [Candidatus Poseidoniales archaeon]
MSRLAAGAQHHHAEPIRTGVEDADQGDGRDQTKPDQKAGTQHQVEQNLEQTPLHGFASYGGGAEHRLLKTVPAKNC